MNSNSDSESDVSPWKYFPSHPEDTEDIENYEPGGFHPVHLGDVYDSRYRIVHKLFHGGFSTVWLARETLARRWVALKIVVARESATYEARSVIESHPGLADSPLFAVIQRRFWLEGPNGRHLCLVYPVLGPDLSRLSNGIYTRLKPAFAREVSLQAARALAYIHSKGWCHGDLTASNIVLRLSKEFDSYGEEDVFRLFGHPKTSPLIPCSREPPGPHGPDYIVVPLDFCSSPSPADTANVLSSEICIIDFDQSFSTTGAPPPGRPGIPAKYLAPEVAVGRPLSPASDVWALGCAIFRIRSGDDLFFDYDTNCPADALRLIVKAMGELPEEWQHTEFDKHGFPATDGKRGKGLLILKETQPLEDRVRRIVDEPPTLSINGRGETVELDEEPVPDIFEDDPAVRVPYSAAFTSMLWKPTAVCVDGAYFAAYSETDETDEMLEAFPKIPKSEAVLLIDLLTKVFAYDPATRLNAEDLALHPWFHMRTDFD